MIDESPRSPNQQSRTEEQGGTAEEEQAYEYAKKAKHYLAVGLRWSWQQILKIGWAAFATVIIAITTIVYTHYAGKQWQSMQSQLTEMQKSTGAAQKAAEAAVAAAVEARQGNLDARDRFRQDERPYIWVTNLGQPVYNPKTTQFVWTWHISNYGKSPAYNIKELQYAKLGNLAFPSFKKGQGPDLGAPLPPGGDQLNTVVSPPGITQQAYETLYGSDNGIGILVKFSYTDGYGGKYETAFCYGHLVSGALNYCRDNNYIK